MQIVEGLGLTDSRHLSGVEATDSCLASRLVSDEQVGTRGPGWWRGGVEGGIHLTLRQLPSIFHW